MKAKSLKIVLLVTTILLSFNNAISQTNKISWSKTYGGIVDDRAMSIIKCTDSGYIFINTSSSDDGDVHNWNGVEDVWIVRTDDTGAIIWERKYGGTSSDFGKKIIETQEGFIVFGYSSSSNNDVPSNKGQSDYWVFFIDKKGKLIWSKTFGGTESDQLHNACKTSDGYIVCGMTISNNGDVVGYHGGADMWVLKLDNTGNVVWKKCLGGSKSEFAYGIAGTTDGGCIISGYTNSNDGDVTDTVAGGSTPSDAWVIKLSSTGSIIWNYCYGGTSLESANTIQQTKDGGYIFAGYTKSNDCDVTKNNGKYDYWIVKLNTVGNIQWQHSYGGSNDDIANKIIQTVDSGYVVVGNTYSTDGDIIGSLGGSDVWALKIDVNGNIMWKSIYGGTNDETGNDVIQTTDKEIIIACNTTSGNNHIKVNKGRNDSWLLKTGNVPLQIKNTKNVFFCHVYPTISDGQFFLEVPDIQQKTTLIVKDISGKSVYRTTINDTKSLINLEFNPSGIYFFTISSNSFSEVHKVVIDSQ